MTFKNLLASAALAATILFAKNGFAQTQAAKDTSNLETVTKRVNSNKPNHATADKANIVIRLNDTDKKTQIDVDYSLDADGVADTRHVNGVTIITDNDNKRTVTAFERGDQWTKTTRSFVNNKGSLVPVGKKKFMTSSREAAVKEVNTLLKNAKGYRYE